MNLEVVLVPEHQVAKTIPVVVHLVDTAFIPRVVSVSIGAVDPAHLSGPADLHWIRELAGARLDEHPEAIDARDDQVVAAVAVHVPSDVYMGDLVSARRVEVGSDRDQRALRGRFGIEPVQATGVVGDQPVASPDVGDVNEQHFGTECRVDSWCPGAVNELVDSQAAFVAVVDVHHGKLGACATEKKSRQDGLTFRGAGDDLVLRESEFRRRLGSGLRGGRPCAPRQEYSERQHGGQQYHSKVRRFASDAGETPAFPGRSDAPSCFTKSWSVDPRPAKPPFRLWNGPDGGQASSTLHRAVGRRGADSVHRAISIVTRCGWVVNV